MQLKLNWIGMHVVDFESSLRFYTETLGMHASDIKSDWAYIESTGMTFELFGVSGTPTMNQSLWGHGQPIRPSLQVADLHKTVAELRQRGVQFIGDIQQTSIGEFIEFIAPENMRWILAHVTAYTFSATFNKPHIGWLELNANRLTEQQAFYANILGMRAENGNTEQVILRQGSNDPLLFLESGGQRAAPFQIKENTLEPMPSHLISVETDNIEEAAAWIKSHNIPILTEITRKTWGGIDFYIVDVDGYPIQIVKYAQ